MSSQKMMFSRGSEAFLMIEIRFSVLNHKEFRAIVVMPSANSYGICFQKWSFFIFSPKIARKLVKVIFDEKWTSKNDF